MERVITFAEHCSASVYTARGRESGLTQRAVVAWELALGAGAVVRIATDATHVVVRHIPPPGRDGVPLVDCDFHRVSKLSLVAKVVGRGGSGWDRNKHAGIRGEAAVPSLAPELQQCLPHFSRMTESALMSSTFTHGPLSGVFLVEQTQSITYDNPETS